MNHLLEISLGFQKEPAKDPWKSIEQWTEESFTFDVALSFSSYFLKKNSKRMFNSVYYGSEGVAKVTLRIVRSKPPSFSSFIDQVTFQYFICFTINIKQSYVFMYL